MLENVKKQMDEISPTICLAKWFWVTMHMGMESNHSCYHPPIHKWDLNECQNDCHSLHNTSYKKQQRKMMLEGKMPDECEYCWKIENFSSDVYSDRILTSSGYWAIKNIDRIKNISWDDNISPTYLEISFSNTCNLACSYCSPGQSSRWEADVKKNGPYPVRDKTVRYLHPQLKENDNPYIKIFWKWFEEVYADLEVIRITGGEPLMTDSFFKIAEYVKTHPNKNLTISVNTNLCCNDKIFNKFLDIAKHTKHNVKRFTIFTSLDTWGDQAEYIRDGLSLERFERNLWKLIDSDYSITIMATFGILSIFNYKKFLDKVVEWKSRSINNFKVTPAILSNPTHFDIRILDSSYKKYFDEVDEHFEKYYNQGYFNLLERNTWKVIYQNFLDHMNIRYPEDVDDFRKFFNEYDKRRNKNFHEVFPELNSLWRE